jgi:cell division control protein 6
VKLEEIFDAEASRIRGTVSKLKNPAVFDLKYIPSEIYVRKELETIVKMMAGYSVTEIPAHIIIFGSRGSGKTVSILYMLKILETKGKLKTFYVKARECPSSYKIYMKMAGVEKIGYSPDDLRKRAIENYGKSSVIVIDDADFLEDFNFLYTFTRSTNASIILLTQNIQLINRIDESTYSSMLPSKIYFADYKPEEIYQILRMRAEEGLYKWDDEALRRISATVVRDYRSDTRVAIKSLFKLAITNKWDEENVKKAVEDASREVEALTLRELKDRDLITLYIVSKIKETSKAYPIFNTYMARYEGKFLTKPTFFRALNYLQNLGLISQVRKRAGKYYTIEVDTLIDQKIIEEEIRVRFGEIKIEKSEQKQSG